MIAQVLFYLAKAIEGVGLLMMPLALYLGMTLEGGQGMTLELKLLAIGFCIFQLGRILETSTGKIS
jgi:hypothetical protein